MAAKGAELVEVGVVTRPHGVRGEVRVHLHNPDSEALLQADEVVVGEHRYAVTGARAVKDAVLLRLESLTDRNAAELLREQPVLVDREALALEEGEVLLSDLVGCAARLPDGSDFGKVVAVHTGAQDRLVIHQGEVERELPLVEAFIVEVDLEAGTIVVDPPDELPEWPVGT
jgi:16S rRNA processing protein RimM